VPGKNPRLKKTTNVEMILTDFCASPGIEPGSKPLSRKLTPKQKLYGKLQDKTGKLFSCSFNTIPF